jgi:hypothetical protein
VGDLMRSVETIKAAREKWRARKAARAKKIRFWNVRLRRAEKRLKDLAVELDQAKQAKSVWHPGAVRNPYTDAGGSFLNVPAKLVWHTTEGFGLPAYAGSAPHFTLNPKTGQLWQHMPVDKVAKALAHPAGTVETNRAHAIQVELIGFAKDSQNWSDAEYARIAALARWIEHNAGVARKADVKFTVPASRLSASSWLNYSGHIGHAHVPSNDHWDPGRFRIDKVI